MTIDEIKAYFMVQPQQSMFVNPNHVFNIIKYCKYENPNFTKNSSEAIRNYNSFCVSKAKRIEEAKRFSEAKRIAEAKRNDEAKAKEFTNESKKPRVNLPSRNFNYSPPPEIMNRINENQDMIRKNNLKFNFLRTNQETRQMYNPHQYNDMSYSQNRFW